MSPATPSGLWSARRGTSLFWAAGAEGQDHQGTDYADPDAT